MTFILPGDPTVFGNLPVPEAAEEAIITALKNRTYNGYGASVGYEKSRQAVADYVSTKDTQVQSRVSTFVIITALKNRTYTVKPQ